MFKGFFNRMYNGDPNRPDLNPGDMPKNRFELFFTTLGVRFGDLIKLNLLLLVFLLPLIIWTVLTYVVMNNTLAAGVDANGAISPQASGEMVSLLLTYLIGNVICLPLAGPPVAGLTYIVRNYARDEHAWLWSDFKDQMKKNWKQSAGMMLLLDAVLFVSVWTLWMYGQAMGTQSWLWVMELLFVIFVGVFILSYMYAFPMLVTYKLKFGQIIRNSVMLALGRLPFTLIFGLITALPFLIGLFFSYVTVYAFYIMLLYYILIGFALGAFIINSYTNATFDRLMKSDEDRPADPEDREIKP